MGCVKMKWNRKLISYFTKLIIQNVEFLVGGTRASVPIFSMLDLYLSMTKFLQFIFFLFNSFIVNIWLNIRMFKTSVEAFSWCVRFSCLFLENVRFVPTVGVRHFSIQKGTIYSVWQNLYTLSHMAIGGIRASSK